MSCLSEQVVRPVELAAVAQHGPQPGEHPDAGRIVAVARQVSKARNERDRLLLANAAANAAVVVTGLALAFRMMRRESR